MSVNDIITSGAKPLFFLDYYATSRLDVDLAEKVTVLSFLFVLCLDTENFSVMFNLLLLQVIKGIVDGCQQSDCILLGGEVLLLLLIDTFDEFMLLTKKKITKQNKKKYKTKRLWLYLLILLSSLLMMKLYEPLNSVQG